jgi:hypothetical protein
VRLLQFGFTATDLEEEYMAFEEEKADSPAVDNAPAAALTGDQLERQRVNANLDTRYKHKLGDFRRRIPSCTAIATSNRMLALCWRRRRLGSFPTMRSVMQACPAAAVREPTIPSAGGRSGTGRRRHRAKHYPAGHELVLGRR